MKSFSLPTLQPSIESEMGGAHVFNTYIKYHFAKTLREAGGGGSTPRTFVKSKIDYKLDLGLHINIDQKL